MCPKGADVRQCAANSSADCADASCVCRQINTERIRQYSLEINRLKAEASAKQEAARDKLNNLNANIDNIVDAMAAGNTSNALTERLERLEREKEHVLSNLEEAEPDPVRIHPNAADLYIAKVDDLRQALNKEDSRSEAAQMLRSLIEEVRLHPIDVELRIELAGDLARLIGFAFDPAVQKPGFIGNPGSTEWLVAEARCLQFRTQVSPYLPVR